jgi:hypothetical protein
MVNGCETAAHVHHAVTPNSKGELVSRHMSPPLMQGPTTRVIGKYPETMFWELLMRVLELGLPL